MKFIHWTALPLAALLLTPAIPAAAAPPTKEIVVTASPREAALISWSQRVEQDLQKQMGYARPAGARSFDDGVVDVRFVCTESGKPDQIAIARSSGSRQLDRAALNAIRRLTTLHPTVEGMMPNQAVRAQMLYATAYEAGSSRPLEQRIAALRKEAQQRNKWFTANETASNEIVLMAGAK